MSLCASLLLGAAAPRSAFADAGAPSQRAARHRTCCAFASGLPLHLGSAHVPLAFGIVTSATSLGKHSYLGDGAGRETNGIIYTRRGGFIDTGHTREHADATAHLAVRLRPLLAHGGVLQLDPRDAAIRLVIAGGVPEPAIESTSVQLARRISFQISVWVEITQHYGHSVMRGAEEMFSSFTPEDVYSNLLGTYLGGAALESPLPYDRAMDVLLADAFASLEAVPAYETRRILAALAGRWWRAGVPWPSPEIALVRSFDIGPHVTPLLAPAELAPPRAPAVLDVPEVDESGTPLADFYRLEIVPDSRTLPRFAEAGGPALVTADDLPRLVDTVRRSIEAGDELKTGPRPVDENDGDGPLAHYLVGLRLLDLKASGGLAAPLDGAPKGVFGGALTGIRGDTRGGDFDLVHFDVNHTAERGLIAGFALWRSDAVYFCRDPDSHSLRGPLLSLLGPCENGEWLGIGGSIGEAIHDGRTGRTALRPISLYGVVNALGNGQSPSYDGARLLLRGGGAVEHVWTQLEGPTTIPRVGGNAILLLRTPGRSLEAYGGAGYRLDPSTPNDAAFESGLSLRWYFLLGGNRSTRLADGVDPWGVGSLGLHGGYSFWTRPAHSYAEIAPPFVSAEHSGTWQVVVTATLGFEGLTF
jgi:hypothetical protein